MQLQELKGIGPKTEKLFQKLGVYTPSDLLSYFPRAYEIYEPEKAIASLACGEVAAVRGMLERDASVVRVGGMTITSAYVRDASGRVRLTWFNAPYLRQTLRSGRVFTFRGAVISYRGALALNQPRIFEGDAYKEKAGTLEPIYTQTKGLSNNSIIKAVRQAFASIAPEADFVPQALRYNRALCAYADAVLHMHFPESREMFLEARRRLAYNELLLFSLALNWQKQKLGALLSSYSIAPQPKTDHFIEQLPYTLTEGQMETFQAIRKDLASGLRMNRLIQGDVGSGKTIVALLAMLEVCFSGKQAAFMAPTEVLAQQHFETLSALFEKAGCGLRVCLLTGSMSAKEKRDAYARIEAHKVDIIVGTHALIQEKLHYAALALVVTDEQHRFGVNQRKLLGEKGVSPHVLVMSATPIPRTLAMLLYADMQVSSIRELPKNRLPIKNCVVDASYRPKAYRFMQDEVEKGRQAYVICPMVEENDMFALEDVGSCAKRIKKALPNCSVAILHGKMKPKEKDAVMHAFLSGEIDILVSTTVVEVGVDVPNATVMMVENAERFGLAQLHQLRGRVGRGAHQSYCIFVDTQNSEKSRERLKILEQSNDGFFIANEDLRLRGPGDLFGIRQSGEMRFFIADIYEDGALLREAAEDARYLMETDTALARSEHALLKERLFAYLETSETA